MYPGEICTWSLRDDIKVALYIHHIDDKLINRNRQNLQVLFRNNKHGPELLENFSEVVAGVLSILAKGWQLP